jgi:serine/threonine protein kinase
VVDLRPLPFGNYYLLERLAVGGMAEVYLAKCFGAAGYEKLVALKRILPTIAEDDEFIAMFIDEAKIAGQLSHANIASIFDLGKINSSYFIAMEYVSGLDLRTLWDRANEKEGIPLEMACYFTKKICEGLDYAHRRRDNRGRPLGIIHRDVSPQNILVSYDGAVKVIDFGIAKAANRMVRTQTGILKGKFAYMAPEQARGEPIDHRSDIFAIGTMLYELVTGQRAFKADSDFALLEKVRKVDIVPPRKINPQLPKELEKIIAKAMSREAGQRYAWASSLAQDLERFMRDRSLTCNKEQIARFVRNHFKPEFREEKRRIEAYAGYQPEGQEPPDDDESGEGPDTNVTANGQTQVRSDPRSNSSLHEAGTELGEVTSFASVPPTDGIGDDDSFNDHTHQLPAAGGTRVESDDDGGFASTKTLPLQSDKIKGAFGTRPPWERSSPDVAAAMTEVGVNPLHSESDEEASTHLDSGPVEHTEDGEASDDEVANAHTIIQDESDKDVRPAMSSPQIPAAVSSISNPVEPMRKSGAQPRPFSSKSLPPPKTRPGANGASRPSTIPSEPPVAAMTPAGAGPMMSAAAPKSNAGPKIAAAAGAGVVVGAILGAIIVAASGSPAPNTFIVTTPRSAAVSLGKDTLCEKTPCAVVLDEGEHELVIAAGGAAISRVVEVGDEPAFLDVALKVKRRLRLVTEPRGARVTVNGERLAGTTPLTLPELTVGDSVEIEVKRAGYKTVAENFEVPDPTGPWILPLQARATQFSVVADPSDAVVTVNNKTRVGKLDVKVTGEQAVGVVVARAGCVPKTVTLLGTGAESEAVKVKLSCAEMSASLSVTGAPRGAHVHVDGSPTGRRTLRAYALPPGNHVVTIIKGELESSFPVVLTAGKNERVEGRLR